MPSPRSRGANLQFGVDASLVVTVKRIPAQVGILPSFGIAWEF